MKRSIIVLLVLFVFKGYSQNFTSKGKVEFDMITNIDGFQEYNAILYFNEEYSKFTFKHKETKSDTIITSIDEKNSSLHVRKIDTSSNSIFLNLKLRELYTLTPKATVLEKNNSLSWELIEEQKAIGKLICYKAMCNFRGRSYIAWYSPEIPLPYGPWKFNGLPGLILEVYDTKKEVYFSMINIVVPYNENKTGLKGNEEIISRDVLKKQTDESLKRRDKELEERAKRIEASSGKEVSIKINRIEQVRNKGIELD